MVPLWEINLKQGKMSVLHRPSNSAVNCVPLQSRAEGSETATDGEVFLPIKKKSD